MSSPQHVDWRDNTLLQHLPEAQLMALDPLVETHEYGAGDVIVAEGEDADRFFLVCSGTVQVYRESGGADLPIATMGAGQYFGVMALMDERARAASVRALEPVSAVAISMKGMQAEEGLAADRTLHAMLVNHAREQNRRLRETGHTATEALERELEKAAALLRLGFMMVMIITLAWAYVIAAGQLATIPELRWITTLGIAVFLSGCGVYFIRRNPYPLAFYGLTFVGWRPAVRDAVGSAALVVAGVTIIKWIAVSVVPGWEGLPVIHMRLLDSASPVLLMSVAVIVYIPVCILQELLVRGIMQSSLAELLPGRNRALWALLLSNALFSMFHVHYSAAVALGTFVLGLYWGWLWTRQKSLPAVAAAHYIVGFWSVEVLDVLPLLGMDI